MEFLHAYIVTLAIETTFLFLLLRKNYSTKQIVTNSLIVNTITLPFVWFFFPLFGLSYLFELSISESCVFGAESLLYTKLFNMKIIDAIKISFICNLISTLFGLVL